MSVLRLPSDDGISKALSLAGLAPVVKPPTEGDSIEQKLDRVGLTEDFLFQETALIARQGESDSLRMRAIETGLKLRKLLGSSGDAANDNRIILVLHKPELKETKDFPVIDVTTIE